MNYRLNQFAMAVLAALVLFFGTRTLINVLYTDHEGDPAGYEVSGVKEGGGEAAEEEAPAEEQGSPVLALLANADAQKGESAAGICKGCHSVEKGGPMMVGPNLYDVVGAPVAASEEYDYSQALKDHGGEWTFENLDAMIEAPSQFAPGTKMAMYPGMPEAEKRADLIAYLRTLSEDPVPLPEGGEGGGEAAASDEPAAPPEPTEEEAEEAIEEQEGPPAEPLTEQDEASEADEPAAEPETTADEAPEDSPAEPETTEDGGSADSSDEPDADAGGESEAQ